VKRVLTTGLAAGSQLLAPVLLLALVGVLVRPSGLFSRSRAAWERL
jgi:hypothetical protein